MECHLCIYHLKSWSKSWYLLIKLIFFSDAGSFSLYRGWNYRVFGSSSRSTSRGLGLFCAVLDWKHLFNSSGYWEHFPGVCNQRAMLPYPALSNLLHSMKIRLLQAAIGGFSSFFPDYQERIARHEAAHFLVAYLIGLPILGYSLDIGKEHVNLIDKRLEKLIYSGQLDTKELDRLAVVAMAGLAAEGLKYDKVVGQSADLFTLQRFINRSKPQLSKDQQQNLTRWAVLFAGSLLKNNRVLHDTLISAMSKKATVVECIEAIEKAE
ncbi:uncharacterized protein LOC111367637 isoform X3 [Olea europaea var. sylvestris]|uniref:uncharacterized protein LOC111367637 isoform X3 n=1 Tax=Olea europaea var. sylvestris TaxID=158386 RepID=UPI000C1CE370|nr:uncharacterized protein LOC111367637 isoform X3 [Olea europaea var. sylvestris]